MTCQEFFGTYVEPFERVYHHYSPEKGFIVWRFGTGRNIELLHIRSFALRKGFGRQLMYKMLDALVDSPPYFSVFGFTRVSNERAAGFYEALGFNLQPIKGLYADGEAMMFWQSYEVLLKLRQKHENNLCS